MGPPGYGIAFNRPLGQARARALGARRRDSAAGSRRSALPVRALSFQFSVGGALPAGQFCCRSLLLSWLGCLGPAAGWRRAPGCCLGAGAGRTGSRAPLGRAFSPFGSGAFRAHWRGRLGGGAKRGAGPGAGRARRSAAPAQAGGRARHATPPITDFCRIATSTFHFPELCRVGGATSTTSSAPPSPLRAPPSPLPRRASSPLTSPRRSARRLPGLLFRAQAPAFLPPPALLSGRQLFHSTIPLIRPTAPASYAFIFQLTPRHVSIGLIPHRTVPPLTVGHNVPP